MNRRVLTTILVSVMTAMVILALLGWFVWRDPGPHEDGDSDSQLVARGTIVYQAHCASCHGANLEGQANWWRRNADGTLLAPPHDATGHTWHHSDDLLFKITKWGSTSVVGPNYKSNMPGFSEVLNDGDIWAVLAYIKSSWPVEIQEAQAALLGDTPQ